MFCGGGMGFLGIVSMLIGTVLFLTLISLAIWILLRLLAGRASRLSQPSDCSPFGKPAAMDILEQRYARGEINQATFERMREHLQASQRTNSSEPD